MAKRYFSIAPERKKTVKNRYEITIADLKMTVISDETREHVDGVVSVVDGRVREMIAQSKQCSKLDAALLCAIDFYDELETVRAKAKNLEAQLTLYEAAHKAIKKENEALKERLCEYEAK